MSGEDLAELVANSLSASAQACLLSSIDPPGRGVWSEASGVDAILCKPVRYRSCSIASVAS